MKSVRRCGLLPLAALSCAALVLTGCEADLEGEDGPLGGGSLEGSVAQAQAKAPEPVGEQLSHQQMRAALDEHVEGASITDTDDWWPHLRDLNRELQKLRVQPTDCKPYVTASALPVPSGSLVAMAEQGAGQSVVYSFEDAESAQEYVQAEVSGLDRCADHTVIRDLGEEEVRAETRLREVDVASGAESALAVRRAVESDDNAQLDLGVLLRQGAVVVAVLQPLDDQDDDEESAIELVAEAAAILSELTGEEITAPEPEPDLEDEDSDDVAEDDGSEESDDDS